jgi:hypothetical protein
MTRVPRSNRLYCDAETVFLANSGEFLEFSKNLEGERKVQRRQGVDGGR